MVELEVDPSPPSRVDAVGLSLANDCISFVVGKSTVARDVVPDASESDSRVFELYAGRFSFQTSPTPFTIASQNSGGASCES